MEASILAPELLLCYAASARERVTRRSTTGKKKDQGRLRSLWLPTRTLMNAQDLIPVEMEKEA